MPTFTFQEAMVGNSKMPDPKGKKRQVRAKHESGARARLPKNLFRGWCLVHTALDPALPEELAPPNINEGQFAAPMNRQGIITLKNHRGRKIGFGFVTEEGILRGQVDMNTENGKEFFKQMRESPQLFTISMSITTSAMLPAEEQE